VFSRENEKHVSELLEREEMPPRVKGLYQAMPRYVAHSASAWVLNAGVSFFKEKWGGVPFLPYSSCSFEPPSVERLETLLQKL
jgi:hypothetical protein